LSAALGLALPRTHVGRVVAHEPGFADLFLDAESGFEVLADGFQWSEGPAWLPPNNALDLPAGVLFSAVRENKIYFYTQDTTRPGVVVFDEASGCDGDDCRQLVEPGTNGLMYHDALQGLVRCEHGRRAVAIVLGGGRRAVLTQTYKGKRFNSPNDLTMLPNGDILFTDPPYGLNYRNETNNFEASAHRDLHHNGVYLLTLEKMKTAISTGRPQEPVRLRMLSKMARPNGIAAAADDAFVVANCEAGKAGFWARCKLAGGTSKCKTFVRVGETYAQYAGKPDGIKMDSSGRLWATGPGGVHVYDQEGTLLGALLTWKKTGNLLLSPEPDNAVYVTADDSLLRIKLKHSIAA